MFQTVQPIKIRANNLTHTDTVDLEIDAAALKRTLIPLVNL